MVRCTVDILSPLGLCPSHFFISLVTIDGYPDIRMNVKFVQDTSKFWYKPEISREQGETRPSHSPSRQMHSKE